MRPNLGANQALESKILTMTFVQKSEATLQVQQAERPDCSSIAALKDREQ